MKYKVHYLPIADTDIANIINYIASALGNVTAANAFLDALDRIHEMIADNPFTFRVYNRLNRDDEEVRIAQVKNYYLFYSISKSLVTVKRVIYQKRNIGTVYSLAYDHNGFDI